MYKGYSRCTKCGGSKQYLGAGMLMRKCQVCHETGWIKDAVETPKAVVVEAKPDLGKVPVFTPKKGRPKRS